MRILSGLYKGRILLSPPESATTRPITGLAKKSLFDTLGPYLVEATLADLYCGTGTMGIEALSRGASHCYFADMDRLVLERLKENLETLGAADRSTVWAGDIHARLAGWLEPLRAPIDIAFVDPPYEQARRWAWDEVAASIFHPLAAHMVDGGVMVLRVPADVQAPPRVGPFSSFRSKCYGEMTILLMRAQEKDH
ncbi:MAG: RsmD family RNA methyltransferase [Phycisphaerae bacterium]|jgi:16S rRNA (guanine966-N2)-methyltransferase